MTAARLAFAAAAACLATLAGVAGCNVPSANGQFTESVPDRASFADVAQAMVVRCGTLDCHGTPYRNLRVYGNIGLRLLLTDASPLHPACTTTPEVDQDFDSVVGLEPEAMSALVASGGANPGSLTMIRKARGTESHKGGVVMKVGDPLDTCFTSWLAGSTQTAACQDAGPPTFPPPAPGQAPACEPGP